jgi:hypothetical protein
MSWTISQHIGLNNMPSVSKKQHNLMEAVAHSPAFAKKVGIKQSVGKDFAAADKGKTFKKGGPSLAVGRGEKLPVSQGAGLTAKGRAKYNAATGSNLKAPQPEGGPRKKSFCARMSGMPGPMKDENGKPTRKAASLKRWKC